LDALPISTAPRVVSFVVSLSGSTAHNPLRRMQHHPLHCLGIGLLIRTKQRLLVLPSPGFHHVTYRVALPFGSPLPADRVPHHPPFGPLAVSDDAVRLAVVGRLGWIKKQRATF